MCPLIQGGMSECSHGLSCIHCSNRHEFLYHPENYRTVFCKTTATRSRCKAYPVCPYAHNAAELRVLSSNKLNYVEIRSHTNHDIRTGPMCSLYYRIYAQKQWNNVICELPPTFTLLPKKRCRHYAAKYCRYDVLSVIFQLVYIKRGLRIFLGKHHFIKRQVTLVGRDRQ